VLLQQTIIYRSLFCFYIYRPTQFWEHIDSVSYMIRGFYNYLSYQTNQWRWWRTKKNSYLVTYLFYDVISNKIWINLISFMFLFIQEIINRSNSINIVNKNSKHKKYFFDSFLDWDFICDHIEDCLRIKKKKFIYF